MKNKILIWAYISILLCLATLLAIISLGYGQNQPYLVRDIAFFILFATLAEGYNFVLSNEYVVSAHPAIHLALIFLLPPPAVILVVFISILVEQLVSGKTPHKLLFNIAHHVIITGVPAIIVGHFSLRENFRKIEQHSEIFIYVPLIVVLYYLLDIFLVDVVIALSSGESFFNLWREINQNTLLFDLTLPAIGLIMAVLWLQSPLFCLLLVLPIAVNQFALTVLKRLESKAEELQTTLQQLENKLALEEQTARRIRALANRLYEVSTLQIQGSKRQATAVTQAVVALAELSNTAAKLASNAESGARLTNEISASTSKARDYVDSAIHTISKIEERITSVDRSVGGLNEQLNQARKVAEIINEIVSEVKLLALNATIEASGAGVYGERFRVVAREVRELAQVSHVSARQVEALITQIQSRGIETVQISETGVKEVETSVKEAQEAVLYNLQILLRVEQIADLMKQTSVATSQQQANSQRILELMREIEMIALDAANSTQQIENVVAELKEAADVLNEVLTSEKPRLYENETKVIELEMQETKV